MGAVDYAGRAVKSKPYNWKNPTFIEWNTARRSTGNYYFIAVAFEQDYRHVF
jgi:hypothetical protein